MSHLMPTDSEIRARIESVKDEKYRMAFIYQYLIAGRISEVCGRYAPRKEDMILTDFDGELAIMFIVKTAKRKGRLRGVAIPLRVDYEPWTDKVRMYIRYCQDEYPFRFADKWATSVRYMQWQAEKAFEGLEWPMVGYSIKTGESINPITNEVIKEFTKIPSRWKNVTSHVLRKRRTLTLLFDYNFDGVDLSLYGGWTESSQAEAMPQALKHYLYVDPSSSQEPIKLLKKMSERYFKKLCKPY